MNRTLFLTETPPATHEENARLCKRFQDGDEDAGNELVERNWPFIITIANQIGANILHPHHEDCLSVGASGLVTAARRFDPAKGAHFSTYAAFWIKQSIRRYLHNSQYDIRIPIHVAQNRSRVKAAATEFEVANGRRPTIPELVALTKISAEVIGELFNLPISISAETPIGEDGDADHYTLIPDQRVITADMAASARDEYRVAIKRIRDIIAFSGKIPGAQHSRNNLMFCQRYGLDGFGPPKTLEDVGETHNLTRERVRQLNEKVFHAANKDWAKARYKNLIQSEAELYRVIDTVLLLGEILWTHDGVKPEGFDLVSTKEVSPSESGRSHEALFDYLSSIVNDEGDQFGILEEPEMASARDALVFALVMDLNTPLDTFVGKLPEEEHDHYLSLVGATTDLDCDAKATLSKIRQHYTLSMWGSLKTLWEKQGGILYGRQRDDIQSFLSNPPNGATSDEIIIAKSLLGE